MNVILNFIFQVKQNLKRNNMKTTTKQEYSLLNHKKLL